MYCHIICTVTSYVLSHHMYCHIICTVTSYVLSRHMYGLGASHYPTIPAKMFATEKTIDG